MNLKSHPRGEVEDKRAWPWVVWFIWKSRNDFLFNGVRWTPKEIVLKEKSEADEWFLAQEVDREVSLETKKEEVVTKKRWVPRLMKDG